MPKAHEIEYRIIGDCMQGVIVSLDPKEAVQAEAGAMLFMEDGIEINTEAGGIMKGVKRILAGESFFITTFYNSSETKKKVGFAAPYPGKILAINLNETGPMLCQRDAYLCSAYGIDISVAFTKKLGAGFFGGEGFILQKLSGIGPGTIYMQTLPFSRLADRVINASTRNIGEQRNRGLFGGLNNILGGDNSF